MGIALSFTRDKGRLSSGDALVCDAGDQTCDRPVGNTHPLRSATAENQGVAE